MSLKVYNTLTRKLESFKPINPKKVRLFVCGITPYDYAHIGHAKTYVQFDVIAKYLRYKGYDVFYLQNVTNIDDKIISRAKELKKEPLALSAEYEHYYHEDMAALGVDSIDKYARATDYIQDIVNQVQKLLNIGYAYKISDGYYFNLNKFNEYGKLSGRTILEAEDSISRIDDSKEKINKGDFCLWKFYKGNEPYWETDLGKGRPGWHIEDTAITEKDLGQQYDIHGGARDLIFPHHEAEIAQMESISKKSPFVRYWLHTGFLVVKGQKMSKSLGNFITIKDALKKYSPDVLRLFFILTHYRSAIDFDEKNLKQAESTLNRLNDFIIRLKGINSRKACKKTSLLIKGLKSGFEKAMDNDFNTPEAFASLFNFMKEVNILIDNNEINKGNAKKALDILCKFDTILCLNLNKEIVMPDEIKLLVDKREQARKEENFKLADKLRQIIKEKGYILEDTPHGIRCKKLHF